jgi:hypothetical protein
MKKLLLVLLCMLPLSMNAQSEYHQFVKEGKTWLVFHFNLSDQYRYLYTMFLKGDTVIGDYTYKKLYTTEALNNPPTYLGTPAYIGAFRENGSKVYYQPKNKSEYCLYDFSLKAGDTFNAQNGTIKVNSDDQIPYYGINRKTLHFQKEDDSTKWIEGVGSFCRPDYSDLKYSGNCDCLVACIESSDTIYYDSVYGYAQKYIDGVEPIEYHVTLPVTSYYDLLGRQLATRPEHGMYISGGKKYVKK